MNARPEVPSLAGVGADSSAAQPGAPTDDVVRDADVLIALAVAPR